MIETRLKARADIPGLKRGADILATEYAKHFERLLPQIRDEVRQLQREDTGEERNRTRYRVLRSGRGGLSVTGNVYNTSIQAAVDEGGAKPHFPPYKQGSKLFRWVSRKGLANETQVKFTADGGTTPILTRSGRPRVIKGDAQAIESISFLIARAQSRRGLPRRGDPIRFPMNTLLVRRRGYINSSFIVPTLVATRRINA